MPFTFSHPALVIPLINADKQKKLFSVSGLVIGSMIPDFESFLTLNEYKQYGHTWLGVYWFDLPLAIMAWFIFHGIVRSPLIKNLPGFFSYRLAPFIDFDWWRYFRQHFFTLIISLLIGIYSHLLWDAFTHLNLRYPDAVSSKLQFMNMRFFIFLQDSNSVIGLLVIFWYLASMPTPPARKLKHETNIFRIDTNMPAGKTKAVYWTIFSIVTSLLIILFIQQADRDINIILLIDMCIAGILSGFVITPVLQKLVMPGR